MRLYPKKLHSLEELKREKQVLKYAKKHTHADGLLDIKANTPPGADKQSDILSMLGDLATSKSFSDIALTVGLPMLKLAGRKVEKSFLKTFLGEVIGGYMKWKLLQMGMRGVRLFIRMQKSKHEKEKAEHKSGKERHYA